MANHIFKFNRKMHKFSQDEGQFPIDYRHELIRLRTPCWNKETETAEKGSIPMHFIIQHLHVIYNRLVYLFVYRIFVVKRTTMTTKMSIFPFVFCSALFICMIYFQ